MRINLTARILVLALGLISTHEKVNSQVVNNTLAPYVIFSGPDPTGTTLIGSSITINGVSPSGFRGAVGGVSKVQSTGSAVIKAHIRSWNTVDITNKNILEGDITANGTTPAGTTINVVSLGSNVNLTGNIHSRGNIYYGGGTFIGSVNVSPGIYLSSNPTPSILPIGTNPVIPPQPSLPIPNDLSGYPALQPTDQFYNITGNFSQGPGNYGDVNFSGNRTLELKGPGVYVFNSMLMTGNTNKIKFDFGTNTTGKFYVFIKGNADLGKIDASVSGSGASASRIWIEVQGTGTGTTTPTASFIIANGSGGGSKLQSTVYATRAAILIGSGTGSGTTSLSGALYSKTAVSIQSGVTINYVPFDNCTPITANAGPDQTGASTCGLTTVTMAGSNPSPGTGQWSIVSGTGGSFGNSSSPTSTFSGVAGNTYTLRWTITNSTCAGAGDDVVITFNKLPENVNADPGNKESIPLDFNGKAGLKGQVSNDVTSLVWTTGDGVIIPPANAPNITVASAGLYTLTGTTIKGCSASDNIVVTGKRRKVIGSELQSLYENYDGTFKPEEDSDTAFFDFIKVGGIDYVTIDIIFYKIPNEAISVTRANLTTLLMGSNYGLINILPNGLSPFTITGDFPIVNLPKLDALDDTLNYCRPYYRPFNNGLDMNKAADITTFDFAAEGDTTIRAHFARSGYDQGGIALNGTGVKLGIISDSYRNLDEVVNPPTPTNPFYIFPEPNDVTAGRLPFYAAGDPHIQDFPKAFKRSDEGRAMAEIVHRVSKGAEIFFRTGVYTAGDFAAGIEDLASKGCKVIVDDITYPTEPFLKDGIVAKTVNKVVADPLRKVLYFTAAGNFARNAYEADYHAKAIPPPGTGDPDSRFPGLGVHEFKPGEIAQKIKFKSPGNYMLVLQWADNFYSSNEGTVALPQGTIHDLDFYIAEIVKVGGVDQPADGKGLIGFNRNNLGGDAIEFIPISIPNDGKPHEYYLYIVNNSSKTDGPERVKYIAFKNDIEFLDTQISGQNASTISGQGNADGAITIGAARYYHVPGHPLLEDPIKTITKPRIERTSSVGGTTVVDDNFIPKLRLKPDLVGPDGGTVTVKLSGIDYPIFDNVLNFYGTSAAAPHVAAGVALILQGLNKFKGQNIQNMEPAEMKKLIQKSARDMRPDNLIYNFDNPLDPNNPPYDFVAGAGLLNVDAAMRTFAAPEPFQIRLIREAGKIPCQESFVLTIVGQNFSTNTEIYITNEGGTRQKIDPSLVTYVSPEKILVTINSCIGNPLIEAFTPATVTDPPLLVVDGGWSNGIRLFDKEIIVQTKLITKKYGQDNPAVVSDSIIATLIDNGVTTTIVPADYTKYGLNTANLKSNTTATRYSEVNLLDYTIYRDFSYPADSALTNNYRYTFNTGKISIEKMPLKVIPLVNNSTNATVFEGRSIGDVTFDYQFWKEQPAEPVVLKDVAKKFHEAFLPGNALAVVKDFKKTQADGTILSDADLENMSMMTTFKALKNSRKFMVDQDNRLIPETNPNSLVSKYLVDLASESVYGYTNHPKKATFYEGYPGITKKALLSKTALEFNEGKVKPSDGSDSVVLLNGSVSATLAPLFNGTSTLAPLFNGNQISVLDGKLATVNSEGKLVAVPNSPSILYLNGTGGVGSLVYIINGATSATLAPLFNGAKIEMLNNSNLTLNAANSYIKFENNDSAGLYVGNLQSINNAVSGTLMFILNGDLAPLPNYSDLEVEESSNTLMNRVSSSTLAPLFNGSFVALNGTSGVGGLATLLNGGGVGQLPVINGVRSSTLAPLFNSKSTLASLLNGAGFNTLASLINNVDLQFTNGATSSPTLASLLNNSGGGGGIIIEDNNAVIVDETDVSEQDANYLGAMFGINMITGLELGTQTVVPGTLINPNFEITYVNSHVTIEVDPSCLHTHSTAKNFSSTPTPQAATTLWINVTTKVSGQLNADGKYIQFHNGTFELKNIDYTPITGGNLVVPDGIIIAKDTSTAPFTDWDGSKWITTVPVNFASSSDLFITGKILSSSHGFSKVNNNASTAIKGYFYTNASFSDQWTYAMAAYRPYFNYTDIDEPGDVVAVNLTGNGKAAGTPMPIINNNNWTLVPGGSGGGGNNYTGSTLSWAKLTPCPTVNSIIPSSANSNSMIITMMESEASPDRLPSFNMYPNPASNRINISFVPEETGKSRIVLYTMDGKKAVEINNGITEAGKSYLRTIEVGKLSRGIYLVQLWNGDKISVGKVVINR